MENHIINCKEPGCDQIFINPCKEVVSFLSMIVNLNTSRTDKDNMEGITKIEIGRKNLKEKGIVNLEEISMSFDDETTLSIKVKSLTLRCNRKHRHQYIVECK